MAPYRAHIGVLLRSYACVGTSGASFWKQSVRVRPMSEIFGSSPSEYCPKQGFVRKLSEYLQFSVCTYLVHITIAVFTRQTLREKYEYLDICIFLNKHYFYMRFSARKVYCNFRRDIWLQPMSKMLKMKNANIQIFGLFAQCLPCENG